jgi:hypothetical protein
MGIIKIHGPCRFRSFIYFIDIIWLNKIRRKNHVFVGPLLRKSIHAFGSLSFGAFTLNLGFIFRKFSLNNDLRARRLLLGFILQEEDDLW